jgi:acyl-CoA synthetase (AMP-forming)/AMP-acid ligase II
MGAMLTHAAVLRCGAAGYGRRIAVSFDGRDITYGELDTVTTRLACGLLDAGLRDGSRVAWVMTNHVDYLLLYYATAKAGMAISPLNPRLPPPELEPMLALVDPDLVVVAAHLDGSVGKRATVVHGSRRWHELLDAPTRPLEPVSEHTLVGDDRPGELLVRAATVMDGYVGRPDLTEAAFAPGGWLRTGDVVRRDDEGYLYLVDRVSDLIITGGENVYPTEVEAALCALPGVLEAAVIGVPDPVYEERVLAIVRLSPDSTTSAAELSERLRRSLAASKVPRRFEFVDDFPRTPLGKIAKAELRKRFGSVFET